MAKATRDEWKHRLIFGLGGALAIVLAVLGVLSTDTSDTGNVVAGPVEDIIPNDRAIVELQQEVGIDLDAGLHLDAQIFVDGVAIPADEYNAGDINLGQFIFKPGAGRSVREWTQGPHTVVVKYWPKASSIEVGPISQETWTFTAA